MEYRKWGKNEGCSPQKVILPKRKYLSISVYIICSVMAEYALWEEEKRSLSEDLTTLSDGARGPLMNNTWGLRKEGDETDWLWWTREFTVRADTLVLMGLLLYWLDGGFILLCNAFSPLNITLHFRVTHGTYDNPPQGLLSYFDHNLFEKE